MKASIYKNIYLGVILCLSASSCENYLEVDQPNHRILSEAVFDSEETAFSALQGIYHELFRSSFSRGHADSVTILAGLSGDNLKFIKINDLESVQFDQNEILPDNKRNLSLWGGAYNIIYMCNSFLEGIQGASGISEQTRLQMEGEAKAIRAFTYFYLVNLFGDVPLLLSTDYRENSLATQSDKELVYDQILMDLHDAADNLGEEYRDEDRTNINRSVAHSLLARVNLYLENWNEAERFSSLVINESDKYELKTTLTETFLANSAEAIWQISPMGNGGILTNTNEGYLFIVSEAFPSLTSYSLTEDLIEAFDPEDKRLANWIGYNEELGIYYAHKYKDGNSLFNITEYSMVIRLAELFLIRAEARSKQGDIAGSLSDLDALRNRAGLTSLSQADTNFSEGQIHDMILMERRRELFTEWGHRWLDLKRTGNSALVLGVDNTLYPIPDEEREKNPNLKQNPNY